MVVLLSVLLAAPGLSDLRPGEKRAFLAALTDANAAFDAGDYASALRSYDRAAALAQLPDLDYGRARCLERLGRPGDAAEALRAYLDRDPRARDRARVEAEIARLLGLRRTALAVRSTPSGALVRLDGPTGRTLGTTPLDHQIPLGPLRLHLTAEGHQPADQALVAKAGEALRVDVDLAPVLADPPPPPPPENHDLLGWSLVGTGGALGVASGVLFGLAQARIDEANAYDRRAPGNSRAELEDLEAPIDDLEVGGWVTGGTAVAALVAGGLLLWLGGEVQATDSGAQIGFRFP